MEPVEIREMKHNDIGACREIVRAEWGDTAADRAQRQMIRQFTTVHRPDAPQFYVADLDGEVIGFSAFEPTSLMKDTYDFIWIALKPFAQGLMLGTGLTEVRLREVEERGGKLVCLMTEKPGFFKKFGFQTVEVFDGWNLMTKKLGKVEI